MEKLFPLLYVKKKSLNCIFIIFYAKKVVTKETFRTPAPYYLKYVQ